MADKTVNLYIDNTGAGFPAKFHDNGDGTFSLQLYAGTVTTSPTGTQAVTSIDGGLVSVGAVGDVEVAGAGNATQISILKRLRTLLSGGLPAALAANLGLKVELVSLIAGEDQTANVLKVEERFSYQGITTATTTTVKSGAGFLHAITVNTTAAGTIKICDALSNTTPVIGTLKASVVEATYFYDVAFATGLTIVTAGASDITVSYR